MQPDTLRALLVLIWGPGYLAPASAWLGRHKSTVSNWTRGHERMPDDVPERLLAALPGRRGDLKAAEKTLLQAVATLRRAA